MRRLWAFSTGDAVLGDDTVDPGCTDRRRGMLARNLDG